MNGKSIQILIIIRTIIVFIPAFQYYMPVMINPLILLLLLFLIATSKKINFVRTILITLPIILLELVHVAQTESAVSIYYLYNVIRLVAWPLIVSWIIESDNYLFAKKLCKIILFCFCLTAITTIIGNTVFPNASRNMAAAEFVTKEMLQTYYRLNIGDFTFPYYLCLIEPLIIYLFVNKLINRTLGLGIILLFMYAIIKTEYTTAFIFFILLLPFLFLSYPDGKKIRNICLLGVALFFLLKSLLPVILDFIADNVDSQSISTRMDEINGFLSGELEEETDLYARQERWQKSILAFKQNIFWGAGGDLTKIGGHSFLLDKIGQWGLLGIIGLFLMFGLIYKNYLKKYKEYSFYPFIIISLLLQIAFAALNPAVFYDYFLCIIPIYTYALSKNPSSSSI